MWSRILFCTVPLLGLLACRLPEQRQEHYSNGTLKERFWVYELGGREVMNGLYVSYYPNGEKEVEIMYQDGSEVTKTYYTERGTILGTVNVASLPDPDFRPTEP